MWFLKNFIKKNTLKGLLCFSLCSAQTLNASFSLLSSYPNSASRRLSYPYDDDNSSYRNEKYQENSRNNNYDYYLNINMQKKIQEIMTNDQFGLDYIDNTRKYYDDEKFESEAYKTAMIEAFLENKEKEITKEEETLTEEIREDLSEEEKKINNSIKRSNKKLKDQIKEMRELIEKKNQEKKQEFDEAIQKLDSEESSPQTETIFKFIESFVTYLQLARKSDVLSIQKQSKEEADNNQLAQIQKKFTKCVGQIASNANIDRIVSDLLRKNNSKVRRFFNCIVYTPAWEEQTQLELLEHINALKDATIRCGFGIVDEGTADSRGIIPIISSRFNRFTVKFSRIRDITEYFTYGFKNSRKKDFEERDYPDTMNIYQDKLKISPKVIQKMQEKDDEWCKFDKYYGSKFFKSGFGLAKVREYLAWIYQKNSSLYLQILENLTKFTNFQELFTKAIFENTLLVFQDIFFAGFVILMTPISLLDNILYIFG